MDKKDNTLGSLLGLLVILFIIVITTLIVWDMQRTEMEIQINELGQAICSEEKGTDFVSYSQGVITCEPIEETNKTDNYDGLKIKVER